jgi:hypothetical protein
MNQLTRKGKQVIKNSVAGNAIEHSILSYFSAVMTILNFQSTRT